MQDPQLRAKRLETLPLIPAAGLNSGSGANVPGPERSVAVESFFSGVQRLRQSEGGGPSPFRDNFLLIGCQYWLDVKAGT